MWAPSWGKSGNRGTIYKLFKIKIAQMSWNIKWEKYPKACFSQSYKLVGTIKEFFLPSPWFLCKYNLATTMWNSFQLFHRWCHWTTLIQCIRNTQCNCFLSSVRYENHGISSIMAAFHWKQSAASGKAEVNNWPVSFLLSVPHFTD